jgi:outer membrane protein TolC
MRFLSLPVAVALTLAGTGAQAQAPASQVERWDLRRFETEALKRNPGVGQAREEVSLNRARQMEAAWARFPRFEWQSVAAPIPSLQGSVLQTNTPTNQFIGFGGIFQQHKLDIFLPIFTFGKISNAVRAAEAGVAAAEHGVDRARAEVVRDVRKAYYSVKVASQVMKIIQEGWERIVDAEKKLEELLEKGSKKVEELDKNRLATFSADVANRREEAIKFNELALHALRTVVGLPPTSQVEVDAAPLEPVRVAIPPLETLIEQALQERPEVKALAAAVQARRSLADLNRSYYYPDFFVAGTVGIARCNVCTDQTNPFVYDPFNMDLYGAVVGVRLTLDYPQKIARVRQADAEVRKLELQREQALAGIRLQVRDAYLEWRQAQRQAEVTKKGRKAAQGWLFQSTINFSTGFAEMRDLTDSLGSWFKFRLEELRSVYNYNVAVANLAQAVARDLPAVSR